MHQDSAEVRTSSLRRNLPGTVRLKDLILATPIYARAIRNAPRTVQVRAHVQNFGKANRLRSICSEHIGTLETFPPDIFEGI